MEGPTVSSDAREAQSAERGRFGKECRSPSPLAGLWVMAQKKISKIIFEIACFLHFLQTEMVYLQRRQGNFN